jgi:two-component system, chemotaxis family, chemotaxis protein CheY
MMLKIMLVDDSRTMRRVQKNIMYEIGFMRVIEAENGNDALQKLNKNIDTDLILLDWNMPILNGLDFLKSIKTMPEFKNIPVIMVTSEGDKDKVMEAIKAGAADYVLKPFDRDIIEEKIKRVKGSSRSRP